MNRDHEGEELLILFADLDHLKEINDSLDISKEIFLSDIVQRF